MELKAWIVVYEKKNIPAVVYSDCRMDIFDTELAAAVRKSEMKSDEVKVVPCTITY